MFEIPWYTDDSRFESGTVADIGHAIRLSLYKVENKDEYRLNLQIRTLKKYNNENDLKRKIRVATFKKCTTLKDDQKKSNDWLVEWINDILNNSYMWFFG